LLEWAPGAVEYHGSPRQNGQQGEQIEQLEAGAQGILHCCGAVAFALRRRHSVVTIRVAVVDENEIFRRGVVACLEDNAVFEVAAVSPVPLVGAEAAAVSRAVDVAVVSSKAARGSELACVLVVCASAPFGREADDHVLALLPRNGLTSEQLVAAVQGAAVGLQVSRRELLLPELDERRLRILRLLADGANTEEISQHLRYSQRTIKGLVASIQGELGSRTRAQAVATAIRLELI
jgi:DNA-binding NarL/FixJ family response regulator